MAAANPQGLLYGFHITKQGDPPPTFGMNPAEASHIEILNDPRGEGHGAYLLVVWPDKTVYLHHWPYVQSIMTHLARSGATVAKSGERTWSHELEKEILADARPRPAYRKLV